MGMVSGVMSKRPTWQMMVLLPLAFWLSGSLVLDTLIMPVLYTSGMMAAPDFATAGYAIFWIFNRVELLCAALVLTGALSLCYKQDDADKFTWKFITLSSLLLVVALVYTYALSPHMSALGLHLDLFNASFETPVLMNSLHISYWLLEGIKLVAGGILLKLCFDFRSSSLSVF